MTKRRSRKSIERARSKKRESKKPRSGPKIADADLASLQALNDRFNSMEPDYFGKNLKRCLRDSYLLREEPEFADFYFDPERTLEAAVQNFPHFKEQINKEAELDRGNTQLVYDDYRLAVIDDLDTPQLREDLLERLEQCKARFLSAYELDKLEMTFIILTWTRIGMRGKPEAKPPLGLSGLVMSTYEESLDRAMQTIEGARERIDDDLYAIWCGVHHRKDMEAITAATERAHTVEELTADLEAHPDLALAWERQEETLLEELQVKLIHEQISLEPHPITRDEATVALDKMERRHLSSPWHLSRYFFSRASANFAACIYETVDEVVTPRKRAALIKHTKAKAQIYLESDDDQRRALAPHVYAMLRRLESEPVASENQAVMMFFVNRIADVLGDEDALSPRWQRLLRRIIKKQRPVIEKTLKFTDAD